MSSAPQQQDIPAPGPAVAGVGGFEAVVSGMDGGTDNQGTILQARHHQTLTQPSVGLCFARASLSKHARHPTLQAPSSLPFLVIPRHPNPGTTPFTSVVSIEKKEASTSTPTATARSGRSEV
eukprot:CAMPEP_0172023830 /NCGR_PEP_ID=MMETSP1041-20130122/14999_1 /TAXON_ID=464988 /ORGANISM="Hemiselmis andersenii, Strain CCMP439" /LENGTH=121 /DNA_ID=CAMNT_0012679337 /DNA_START=63 /DNA_END=428 /DNA_ORIENTATION=+